MISWLLESLQLRRMAPPPGTADNKAENKPDDCPSQTPSKDQPPKSKSGSKARRSPKIHREERYDPCLQSDEEDEDDHLPTPEPDKKKEETVIEPKPQTSKYPEPIGDPRDDPFYTNVADFPSDSSSDEEDEQEDNDDDDHRPMTSTPPSPAYEEMVSTSIESELKMQSFSNTLILASGKLKIELSSSQSPEPPPGPLTKDGQRVCRYCGIFPEHVRNISAHERACGSKRIACQHCDKTFNSQKPLQKHMRHIHGAEITPQVSQQIAASKTSIIKEEPQDEWQEGELTPNSRSRTSSPLETPNSRTCKQCGDVFPNPAALRQHTKLVHVSLVGYGDSPSASTPETNANRSLRRRNDSMNSNCSPISPIKSPPNKRTRYPQNQSTPQSQNHKSSPKLANIKKEPGSEKRSQKKFQCEPCGDVFNSEAGRLLHIQKYHSPANYCCHICGKTRGTKFALKRHLMKCHDWTQEEIDERYPDGRKLRKLGIDHNATFHEMPSLMTRYDRTPKPLSHDIARLEELFVLKRRSSLDSDEQKENESIECQVCGKEFDDRREFTLHVTKKHRAKFRRTDGRKIQRRRTLPLSRTDVDAMENSSESSNDTIDGFPCRYCERVLTTKANRIVHERLHTGEKPFQCTICSKAFPCFTYLTSHLEMAHDMLKG